MESSHKDVSRSLCMCPTELDWLLRPSLASNSRRSGWRPEQTEIHSFTTSSCLVLTVSTCPSGCPLQGEDISLCVCVSSPERQPLWAHTSHSFIMRCQAFLSPWLHRLPTFGMLFLSLPMCLLVYLSLSSQFTHQRYLPVCLLLYLSLLFQINRLRTCQFVLLSSLTPCPCF